MRSIALLFFVMVALPICDAQQSSAPSSPVQSSARSKQVGEAVGSEGVIRFDVQVSDESGQPVSGLKSNDFTLLDNGKPQPIVAFREEIGNSNSSSSSFGVVLLIDMLGSLPTDLISFERNQVTAFLRQKGGRLAYPVTIYSLDDNGVYLTSKASVDGNALAQDVVANVKVQTLFTSKSLLDRPALAATSDNRPSIPVLAVEPAAPLLAGLQALSAISTREDTKPGRKMLLWVGPGYRDKGTGSFSKLMSNESMSTGQQKDVFL